MLGGLVTHRRLEAAEHKVPTPKKKQKTAKL